jgi:predicted small lipoprotein YifL
LQVFWYTICSILVNIESRDDAMRNPISATIILLFFLAFLSACGQKGPLFLPGNPSTLQSIPTAEQMQQEIEAEDEEDEDEKPIINPR